MKTRVTLRMAAVAGLSAGMCFAAGKVNFNRDVRPIMSDTCFRCHGPDKSTRMAGLRLDIRDEALKKTASGVIPIVPGRPDESAIVQRVFATNARIMPPKFAHKDLTAAQKETLKLWVAEGANYQDHWSYTPVVRPVVPDLGGGATVRNPIDAFIQRKLREAGLKQSHEADRRTLIRRVSLDLTGLPPAPEEVQAFVADKSPEAYEKVVDRLLASKTYAEKQAIHWLDAVRYADSAGFHGDNPFPAWPYRDYVLQSFHANKPFDVFTREQLAGDLMPNGGVTQKIASAYNRMNRTSAEGGLQPKEYLAKYAADRVRTTSSVWLGATMGCAECHDHKFDPIKTRDFYSMEAFFADIDEEGLVRDRGETAWGAKLTLPSDAQKALLEDLVGRIETLREEIDRRGRNAADAAWEKKLLADYESGALAWKYQVPVSAKALNGATLTIYKEEPIEFNPYVNGSVFTEKAKGEGLIVAGGPNPDNETYEVVIDPGAGIWTALGVDIHQDEGLPGVRLARGADRLAVTEVEAEVIESGRVPRKVSFVLATTTGFGQTNEHPAMAAIDGDAKTAWGITSGESRNPFLALRFAEPVATAAGSKLLVRIRHDSKYRRATTGRFRLALSNGTYSWPETGDSGSKYRTRKGDTAVLNVAVDRGIPPDVLAALRKDREKREEADQKTLRGFFAWSNPELQSHVVELAKLEAERDLLEARIPVVVVTQSTTPRETRILPRGDWMNQSGDVVQPAVPGFLGKLENPRPTRLDLANWIVSASNPLTARVFVNRKWRQFFGTGLSKVLDDLGSQGEMPSHPELLDWLAAEFMQPSWKAQTAHRWDIKHIVRTIVMSHTYRQSSRSTPQLQERDPDNRLLAHQSRYRVDAEVVRDIALSVSGLLAEKWGGPSVRPYQPQGYLLAMNFPKRDYSASRGDDLYRRSLYTFWQRTFLHPSMVTFDASTREECTVSRVNSNTPLQALVMLNDPIFVEAARVFAQHILEEGGSALNDRINWAYLRALGRNATPDETAILAKLHSKSLARFRKDVRAADEFIQVGDATVPRDLRPADLAAMTTVARAILNLHETVTRN